MRRLLLLLAFSIPASAQLGNVTLLHFAGVPTGACTSNQQAVNDATGDLYTCLNGAWHAAGTSTGTGTVTTFTAGAGSPLFTTNVATPTTTPALTFTASNAAANTVFGNFTGAPAAPTFTAAPTFSAANLTNFPTFNQNTTGSAAKWTTPRSLAGNSVDGSADVAFPNKFIVQGTVDAGLSAAQFLGALGTGIVKNTTTTGVLSIAAAGDFPILNQNTTGTAASATNFSGSLAGDVTGPQGTTVVAKINGNSVTTGAANNQALICTSANTCVWKTLPDCVGSSNALNFTAATNIFSCLAITTLTNPMTTVADIIIGGTAGAATRLAAPTATNGVPQVLTSIPSGGVGVAPAWAPSGVPTNAQVGTTYTVAATDRASYVTFSNASPIAVTLPAAGGTGFASNFVMVGCDIGAGTATITPTTSTISSSNGSAYTSAASTLALTTGQCAWIYSDNTNYFAIVRTGGSGSGTVTTTGTPASGNLAKFSGATSIVNGDLSGDVTTSGTLATTIANNAVTQAKVTNGYVDLSSTQASIAGAKTFTAATTVKSLDNIQYVDGVTNTTIAAAITAAGSKGTVIVPPGCASASVAPSTITISTSIHLVILCDVTSSASPNISILSDGVTIEGGGNNSRPATGTDSPTWTNSGSGLTIQYGDGTNPYRGLVIQNFNFVATTPAATTNIKIKANAADISFRDLFVSGMGFDGTEGNTELVRFERVRVNSAVNVGFNFNCTLICNSITFISTYANGITGTPGVGYDLGDTNATLFGTDSDQNTIGYRFVGVGQVVFLGTDSESNTSIGYSVTGATGQATFTSAKTGAEQVPFSVTGAASVYIANALTVSTVGANSVVIGSGATGQNFLVANSGLDKATSITGPGSIQQLGTFTNIEGPMTLQGVTSAPGLLIPIDSVALGPAIRLSDTHASGCNWDFGEIFGVGVLDFRDVSCGGGGYELNTNATAFRSIFSSTNTADRTYTFPNNTGTLAELGLAQTWSALQTFTAGVATGATPPACTAGTAGFMCNGEGTAPTNVASTDAIYADSTTHEYMAATAGASAATPGMMVRVQPSPVNLTAQTAAKTTTTLCAASAGACNTAGQYRVSWNFWGSGTACSSVTAGSVTFLLTWTDANAVVHAAVALPMTVQTGAATTATQSTFPFQTALANESAGGDFTISTNGAVIQYATGYTACTTGTGTYNLRASVMRIQ